VSSYLELAIAHALPARLAWLGAVLDAKANAAHALRISTPDSRVALYVIQTDEELMIARHTLAALCVE
jgi:acetate kinase